MGRPRRDELWRPARDIPFLILCAAVVASMIRSVDQPAVDVGVAGTTVSLVPADLALFAVGALCVLRLLGRGSLPRPARAMTAAAVGFSLWLIASSAANGTDAFVGGGKLLEYGLLALGTVLFVQRRPQLWLFVGLVVALTFAADVYAVLAFFGVPGIDTRHVGGRQGSFMGEHDYSALGTMTLAFGLSALYVRSHRLGRLPLLAGAAGALAVTLAAALAGLVGLYLAVLAVVVLALARGRVTRRALAVTSVVVALVSAGSLELRSNELGFLKEWFGSSENALPGQYSASWSQRLIYGYVGGRIFLDNPVIGTGWYGELPAKEFARYLPDAHRKFPDEPAKYFPAAEGEFTPQQAYDQILYELGIVGAVLFLILAAVTARTAVATGRRWPLSGPDEPAAYLSVAWLGTLAGGLAGAALFGGIPFTAIFWITLGVVALVPSLVPPEPAEPQPVARELAAVAR